MQFGIELQAHCGREGVHNSACVGVSRFVVLRTIDPVRSLEIGAASSLQIRRYRATNFFRPELAVRSRIFFNDQRSLLTKPLRLGHEA